MERYDRDQAEDPYVKLIDPWGTDSWPFLAGMHLMPQTQVTKFKNIQFDWHAINWTSPVQ